MADNVFVQRRSGLVVGVYANRQPGYAEEEVAPNHPDVVAFRMPRAVRKPDEMAVVKVLLDKAVVTRAELDAAAAANGGGR